MGVKINDYAVGDVNLTSVMETLDATRRGLCQVSLTEWATTTEPLIAAGSIVEVNGALYEFESDEEITGSPADGTVYIKLVPSGDSITAEWETDAPSWDDEKQGWYSTTVGEENYRYLPFAMTKSSSSYSNKTLLVSRSLDIGVRTGNVLRAGGLSAVVSEGMLEGLLTAFNSVAIISGTFPSSDGYNDHDYPSGFTQSNTMVIGFRAEYGSYTTFPGKAYSGNLSYGTKVYLTSTKIRANNDESMFYSCSYKILIARLS